MKTYLHPDYWAEIREGEFLTGLSDEQRQLLKQRILEQTGYTQLPMSERGILDSLLEKHYRQEMTFSEEEKSLDFRYYKITLLIRRLGRLPSQRRVWLKRFYIARYRITREQERLFLLRNVPLTKLPGALEEPEIEVPPEGMPLAGRQAVRIRVEDALRFCEKLEGRLPTADEWEKAARGTDGRLYPWGNDFDWEAGYFSRRQGPNVPEPFTGYEVDAFPRGVSPYGIWNMLGGLPELVEHSPERTKRSSVFQGRTIYVGERGVLNRDVIPDKAFIDHLLAWPGGNITNWVTFRPVLDQWPRQIWPGVDLPSTSDMDQPEAGK